MQNFDKFVKTNAGFCVILESAASALQINAYRRPFVTLENSGVEGVHA